MRVPCGATRGFEAEGLDRAENADRDIDERYQAGRLSPLLLTLNKNARDICCALKGSASRAICDRPF